MQHLSQNYFADKTRKKFAFKLVIMSATLDSNIVDVFGQKSGGGVANKLDIPGRTFPVDVYYSKDLNPGYYNALETSNFSQIDYYAVGLVCLRRETKGSKIKGKMGVKWDSREGLDGHQPTASRCDFDL